MVGAFGRDPRRYDRGEDGRLQPAHERLVRARRSFARLVSAGTLFTYLDLVWSGRARPLDQQTHRGGVNAQLGTMLCDHRGCCR